MSHGDSKGTRALRILRSLILWWGFGCALALVLASLRAITFEAPVPDFRSVDLSRDIAWITSRMPAEAAAFVAEPAAASGTPGGWRINGMCLRDYRLGEERTNFILHRRDSEGVVRRTPEHRMVVERILRGWPFHCLEADAWQLGLGDRTTHGMWRIARPVGPPDIEFPRRPLWPGLLANGAIFGCVAWLFARLPRLVEAAMRRRRGSCGRCGHPLAGLSTCPECGTVAASR